MKPDERQEGVLKPEHPDRHCQVGQYRREPFHTTCVMIVCFAPASFKEPETIPACSGSTNAIMLPPRPPPLSFAPNAPARRATSTSISNSGDDTVICCRSV